MMKLMKLMNHHFPFIFSIPIAILCHSSRWRQGGGPYPDTSNHPNAARRGLMLGKQLAQLAKPRSAAEENVQIKMIK